MGAKHGLRRDLDLRPNLISFWGRKNHGEEEEEGKEKKKKKKKEEEEAKLRYGTMTISMDTCFGLYGATFDIRISCLEFDLSRVLLGFHPNPRFLENRGGKTLNGTR